MIKYRFFDKSSPLTNGLYGLRRFNGTEHITSVSVNHQAIKNDMQAEQIVVINHFFGTEIIDADIIDNFSEEPDADAILTTKPGILLTIQTADCVPILLASEDNKVIGAAHCSWHTTQNNILKLLVEKMQNKGANQIYAIIGPAIHQKSYEVDHAFYERILNSEPKANILFIPSKKSGHWMFDLPGFCKLKLNEVRINKIIDHCEDTYSFRDKYHSYRRDTHDGIVGNATNILSTIMICE